MKHSAAIEWHLLIRILDVFLRCLTMIPYDFYTMMSYLMMSFLTMFSCDDTLHAIYSDHIHLPVYESLLVSYWWMNGSCRCCLSSRGRTHSFFVILFKLQLVALAPVSLEAFRVLNGETRAEMTSISRCLSHSTIRSSNFQVWRIIEFA